MPTILRFGPYRFFFYADEGSEPPHIHIVAEKRAKFWVTPVELRTGEINTIEEIIMTNLNLFLEAWNDFFPTQ